MGIQNIDSETPFFSLRHELATNYVENHFEAIESNLPVGMTRETYIEYILETGVNSYMSGIDRHYFNKLAYKPVIDEYLNQNPMTVNLNVITGSQVKKCRHGC